MVMGQLSAGRSAASAGWNSSTAVSGPSTAPDPMSCLPLLFPYADTLASILGISVGTQKWQS